ncbi:MAG: CinA family protein [Zoogloeaceae bacterium]|jgi:nicotinamide-nucleotide amidase|nr:CinA family protein [Zoogloeaceae bacterium]
MDPGLTPQALETLARTTGETLARRGATLATAESCTGGWVAQCLTAVVGASAWFERGFVTYSNAAKVELLDVDPGLLREQGAVSEATAGAMATGALANSRADWALAITGIAGPGGGSPQRPVGTVCFAWARRQMAGTAALARVRTRHFDGDREAIRRQSVAFALRELLALVREETETA